MHAVVLTPDAEIALEERHEPVAGEAFASLRDPERAVKIFLDPAER